MALHKLTAGTLDVLASSVIMSWSDAGDVCHSARVLVPPQIVSSGTASVLHSALDAQVPQLSSASLRAMCQSCPWFVVSEHPDSCKSNLRKQAKTIKELEDVDNCLIRRGRCYCHQCHRCIEAAERGSAGDVHAVCVACTAPSHQMELHKALPRVLSGVQIIMGDPPAPFVSRNRQLLQYTGLRRRDFVQSDTDNSSHLDMGDQLETDEAFFLMMYNGNLGLPTPQHYCNSTCGCGGSREVIVEKMFAAALAVLVVVVVSSSASS